ncbi:MAG: hypothetical protein ACHQFW_03230 [Chitinophagales bacterium]
MKNITQLIKSLSPREVKLFKRYYAIGPKSESNLKNKLFDIILNHDLLGDEDAARLISKKDDNSFKMIKQRLEQDILKFLLWEHDPIDTMSKAVKARGTCRLLMIQVEILMSKGLYTIADQKLLKAERLARKYDLTQDSILIKEFMARSVVLTGGAKFYKKFKDSALEDFRIIKEKFDAQDHYRKLTRPIQFIAAKKLNYIEQARISVEQLKELSERNNSLDIKTWYLKSQTYYNHLIDNYKESKRHLLEELELANSNPKLFPSDSWGGIYSRLAIVSVYMGDFFETLEYVQLAEKYFYKESNNHLRVLHCAFQAYLYMGDYDKARAVILKVKKFKIVKPGSFNYYNWLYYEAIVNFKIGDYKSTLNILQRNSDLTADKTGWRVGFKIVEMMCIIEMQNYDWLDYRIEAFRKLIKSIKNENMSRATVIYELIKKLVKENYNFKTTTEKLKEKLDLLNSDIDEYRWEARGYELIRFDEWWKGKLRK